MTVIQIVSELMAIVWVATQSECYHWLRRSKTASDTTFSSALQVG